MRLGQPFLERASREGVPFVGTIGRLNTTALAAMLILIPFWSTLSAQGTGPISPDERPAWAVDGVPDSVWILVEESWTTDDQDRRKNLLKQAEIQARAASEGRPHDVARRFALAVVLMSRSDAEGGRTRVRTTSEFHGELEAILELDPQYAPAHHLMGRLYAGVRRANRIIRWIATHLLGGGALKKATWQTAEEHLSFAEQQAPEVSDHHFQLAILYADTDRLELALEELEHVFPRPVVSHMERMVWEEALAAKEEWEQKLARGMERKPGCRRVGPRTRRRRAACE